MSTAVETRSASSESKENRQARRAKSFVFHDLSWRQYELLLKAFETQRLRHSYSGGMLEVMSPTYFHEHNSSNLKRIIDLLLTELRIPFLCAGSTTLKRKKAHKALEPDACFYIANHAKILGKRTIDLNDDPPPDLAIEMEYSRTIIPRLPIYAKLGVPEVWRFGGKGLQILRLDPAGKYQPAQLSGVFPFLPIEEVSALIEQAGTTDDMTWGLQVREWVKKKVKDNWK